MNRNELHPAINISFSSNKGYGLTKLTQKGYENLFSVVPPSIPQMQALSAESLRKSDRLLEILSRGNRVLNAIGPVRTISGVDRLLARLIWKTEALASSRTEGTFSTIHEILTPNQAEWKEEAKSILGYANALEFVFSDVLLHKHNAVTVDLFHKIHAEIVSHDPAYDGTPGEFRSGVLFIGGMKERSIYNPAPPTDVPWLMEKFVAWLADSNMQDEADSGITPTFSLPIRMAFAHAHFEAIHPYRDGNGRVGRCIWPIQMILSGYSPLYLSGYVEAEKRTYIAALEAYQKKLNPLPMIEFVCNALAESYSESEASKKALIALPEKWKNLGFRKGSAAYRILDKLLEHPIITVADVRSILGVSEPAAIRAIDQLEKAGVITEKTGFKRNRKFAAEEVISILERPFGTPVP